MSERRTIAELGEEMRAGRTTAAQLTDAALDDAATRGAELNAFVTLDPDGARTAAQQTDAELASGNDHGQLHGIPVAVKDLIDTAGLLTTMGSRHFADHVPTSDAEVVTRLRDAGAIVIGKTVTHEFANGPTGDRSDQGASRNPYDETRITGGSSAGSGAAVAAGIVPLALGTDTGGSVRIPAALCGLVGLRPTSGSVSSAGVFPLAATFDTVGPLARTVADCRIGYDVLRRDAPRETPRPERPRIGWLTSLDVPVDPDVSASARARLGELTTDVSDLDSGPLDLAGLRDIYRIVHGSEANAVHADRLREHPELFGDEVRERLLTASEVRGWEYVRALGARERARQRIAELFTTYDVLALPTTPITAPPIDARTVVIDGRKTPVFAALLSLTSPWSVLGLPALTVPSATVDGLPVGLQLVGAAGADDLLLNVAAAIG